MIGRLNKIQKNKQLKGIERILHSDEKNELKNH